MWIDEAVRCIESKLYMITIDASDNFAHRDQLSVHSGKRRVTRDLCCVAIWSFSSKFSNYRKCKFLNG